ncbi:MAG: cyclopropane-fatty-acyl-phospholipid synthase family protein, partial [Salinirussus sp.]
DGPARLLDVGGGHGYYSIEACQRASNLRATILDAPGALGVAEAEIAAAGIGDRIETRGGDALQDDLGGPYDVAFCFNVAHGFDPDENQVLFGRIADALASDGRLVVLDQFAGEGRFSIQRLGLAFTGFVYNTALGGTVYEADALEQWLLEAGFESVSTTRFRSVPGTGVLEAVASEKA